MSRFVSFWRSFALLVARLGLGGILLLHGAHRYQAGIASQVDVPDAVLDALPEDRRVRRDDVRDRRAGIFLILGALTPLVGLGVLVQQVLTIVWTSYYKGPDLLNADGTYNGGFEYSVALGLLGLLFLVLRRRRRQPRPGVPPQEDGRRGRRRRPRPTDASEATPRREHLPGPLGRLSRAAAQRHPPVRRRAATPSAAGASGRASGAADERGDLRVGQPAEVVQGDGPALTLGQRGHRVPEHPVGLGLLAPARPARPPPRTSSVDRRRAPRPGPQQVDAAVVGHGDEPGLQVRRRVQAGIGAQRGEERLLPGVVGLAPRRSARHTRSTTGPCSRTTRSNGGSPGTPATLARRRRHRRAGGAGPTSQEVDRMSTAQHHPAMGI